MGVHRPRSRLNAYRFYVSPLLAHKASSRAGQETDDVHLRSRLRAKQVMSRVICVPDHSFEQAGYAMGHLHPRSWLHAKQVM
jgi:hypothetical protein